MGAVVGTGTEYLEVMVMAGDRLRVEPGTVEALLTMLRRRDARIAALEQKIEGLESRMDFAERTGGGS